ncbi:MAG TPA: family 16 glycoside hydrolase, partial [Ginsengibacter sp.]|nr:family 16 glycoside hydrolase [Ginsengibacter sp.]
MKYSFIYFVLFILLTFISSTIFAQGNSQVALFNGKDLTGWNSYIGAPLDDAGKKLSEIPVGLNNDPNHVFSIVQKDGEKVIRISGENWGCIYTLKEYSDFQLQLQFKWGTLS